MQAAGLTLNEARLDVTYLHQEQAIVVLTISEAYRISFHVVATGNVASVVACPLPHPTLSESVCDNLRVCCAVIGFAPAI